MSDKSCASRGASAANHIGVCSDKPFIQLLLQLLSRQLRHTKLLEIKIEGRGGLKECYERNESRTRSRSDSISSPSTPPLPCPQSPPPASYPQTPRDIDTGLELLETLRFFSSSPNTPIDAFTLLLSNGISMSSLANKLIRDWKGAKDGSQEYWCKSQPKGNLNRPGLDTQPAWIPADVTKLPLHILVLARLEVGVYQNAVGKNPLTPLHTTGERCTNLVKFSASLPENDLQNLFLTLPSPPPSIPSLLLMPYQYLLSFGKSSDGSWGAEAGRRGEWVARKIEEVRGEEVRRELLQEERKEAADGSEKENGRERTRSISSSSKSKKHKHQKKKQLKQAIKNLVDTSILTPVFSQIEKIEKAKRTSYNNERKRLKDLEKSAREEVKRREELEKEEETRKAKKKKKKKKKKPIDVGVGLEISDNLVGWRSGGESEQTPSDIGTDDPGENFPSSISLTSSLETPSVVGTSDNGRNWGRVCRILKKDIGRFIVKRDAALVERRRGRNMLLRAIKSVVSQTILLKNDYDVTPYGSCLTGLDLPSSDLDIVISKIKPDVVRPLKKEKKVVRERIRRERVEQQKKDEMELPYRIEQLAAKLSEEGWAVQVKPITTTAVPLIKLLADPTMVPEEFMDRIPGQFEGEFRADKVAKEREVELEEEEEFQFGNFPPAQLPPPPISPTQRFGYDKPPLSPHSPCLSWRGADITNNLVSVDITFDVGHHGGIASSDYAEKVVKDGSKDDLFDGDNGDNIIFQVIIVLKEFLAQKHLNEPFTGGLSSYGLMLMVVAIVKQAKWRLSVMRKRRKSMSEALRQQEQHGNTSGSEGSFTVIDEVMSEQPNPGKSTANSAAVQQIAPRPMRSWSDIARGSSADSSDSGGVKAMPMSLPDRSTEIGLIRSTNSSPSTTKLYPGPKQVGEVSEGEDEETWRKIDKILENSLSPEGKLTVGGILMHFLYFYGTIFDAYSLMIDPKEKTGVPTNRTDDRETLDHETGLPSHDPVVILNPLAKGEYSNVAKSCFAFQSLQWFFTNSFHTLELASKNGTHVTSSDIVLLDLIISF
ncbi:hypothetical protein TrVE_jg6895 [Triparma verrucosa]|uniref:Poly(A) RNA polymerase mitochondrial-like central palm domain-containing protein n=1 Tax=Triparma verrucosa TaxID=1606542 RepID=A0A9W7BEQ4_9STRA|nr:hypothetical protein TrVE_jg6895 [Triparma verrucosa]